MTSLELHFKHPATILLSGPTGCGKTRFVRRILEERLIDPFPTRLILVYGEWQEDYDKIKLIYPEIEFVKGYSDDLYDSLEPIERKLLILDDQISEASDTSRSSLQRGCITETLQYLTWCRTYLTRVRARGPEV